MTNEKAIHILMHLEDHVEEIDGCIGIDGALMNATLLAIKALRQMNEIILEKELYLGNCDEIDCGHFRWCGDSYWDRNTECYCLLSGKSVYRSKAEEERIKCPLRRKNNNE